MSRRELFEHAFPIPEGVYRKGTEYRSVSTEIAVVLRAQSYSDHYRGFCEAMDLMDNRHVEWSGVVEIASRWIKRKIKRGAK